VIGKEGKDTRLEKKSRSSLDWTGFFLALLMQEPQKGGQRQGKPKGKIHDPVKERKKKRGQSPKKKKPKTHRSGERF